MAGSRLAEGHHAEVEDGRIARNPALGIKVAGTKGTPGQALLLGELRIFVAALTPPHHEIALVLALAGLRWSEIAALDERDVATDDAGRRFLVIRHRHVLDEQGKRVTLTGTKGGRGVTRMVPVLPELVPILELHLTGQPDAPLFPRREVPGSTPATGGATAGGRRRANSSAAPGCDLRLCDRGVST